MTNTQHTEPSGSIVFPLAFTLPAEAEHALYESMSADDDDLGWLGGDDDGSSADDDDEQNAQPPAASPWTDIDGNAVDGDGDLRSDLDGDPRDAGQQKSSESLDNISVERILNFSDADASEYAKKGKFIAAFLRLYVHYFALASDIDGKDNFNLNDNSITSNALINDIKHDTITISSYLENNKSVLNKILPLTTTLQDALQLTDNRGRVIVPPPKTYAEALSYPIKFRGNKEQSNNKMIMERIDALFTDLGKNTTTMSANPVFGEFFGSDHLRSIKHIVRCYDATVRGIDIPEKRFNNAVKTVSKLIGLTHARYAYSLTIPNPVMGDDVLGDPTKILTQREVRIAAAKLYQTFFDYGKANKVSLESFLKSKGITINRTDLTAMLTGSVIYHSVEFESARIAFRAGLKLIIDHYENLTEKNPSNADFAKKLSLFESYAKHDSYLSKKLKEIYTTWVTYYFRKRKDMPRLFDYKEVYAWLKKVDVEDFFGPKPYTLTTNPSGIVGVNTRGKDTGFYGMIDQNGMYYTMQVYDDQKNVIGGGNIINPPNYLGPTSSVRMNPNYDPVKDNTYPYEVIVRGSVTYHRPSTLNRESTRKRNKFERVNKDFFAGVDYDADMGQITVKQNQFREKWQDYIRSFFGPGGGHSGVVPNLSHFKRLNTMENYRAKYQPVVYAMLCELMYLTTMRISHDKAASGGEKTFGASMLNREHLEFTLTSSGKHKQVVGVKITYPGKGNKVSGPVHHVHTIGHFTTATDSAKAANKHSVDNVDQLKIAGSIDGDDFLPVFLFVLYYMWRFDYNYMTRDFVQKNHKHDKVFTFAWFGRSRTAGGQAKVDERGLSRFMKDTLGMSTSAHNIRQFRGTTIALNWLFAQQSIGQIPNYLFDRQLLNFDPTKGDPATNPKAARSLAEKQSLVKQYVDEVAMIAARTLQHYKNIKKPGDGDLPGDSDQGKLPDENPQTTIKNYINPVVFDKYFRAVELPNPPWLQKLMNKFIN